MADDDRALVRAEQNSVDAYEKRYMAGEGAVLYRGKAKAHWILTALILGTGTTSFIPLMMGLSGGAVVAAIGVVFTLALWLLFLVLRVTVSEGAVNVQYGVFGPKIPVASIVSVEETTYTFAKFGGWGIRRSRDGEWMYNLPGDGGNAVRIVWRKDGKQVVTWIGTRDTVKLARAIGDARKALPEGATAAAIGPADEG